MIVFIDSVILHFFNVEVRVGPGYDRIEFLVAEHGQPFRFDDLQKSFAKVSSLLLNLFVAFIICISQNKIHLVLTTSDKNYLVTSTWLFVGGFDGQRRSMYFLCPLGRWS